jgi:hypothetical protein
MLKRQLIALLWGALVLGALQFASGSAFAHAGHHHGPPAAAAIAIAPDHSAPAAQARDQAILMIAEVSAGRSSDGPAPQANACNGVCCASQNSCCGPVMLPPPPAAAGPSAEGAAMSPCNGSVALGLDPDIPPKPPKFFA